MDSRFLRVDSQRRKRWIWRVLSQRWESKTSSVRPKLISDTWVSDSCQSCAAFSSVHCMCICLCLTEWYRWLLTVNFSRMNHVSQWSVKMSQSDPVSALVTIQRRSQLRTAPDDLWRDNSPQSLCFITIIHAVKPQTLTWIAASSESLCFSL